MGPITKPRNLQNTLEDEIDSVRSDYLEALVRVEVSIANVRVRANRLLDSVFRNRLKNTIQHNNEDVPEVAITVTEGDEVVRVRIADNTPGVLDERKESIFGKGKRPRQRGDWSRSLSRLIAGRELRRSCLGRGYQSDRNRLHRRTTSNQPC